MPGRRHRTLRRGWMVTGGIEVAVVIPRVYPCGERGVSGPRALWVVDRLPGERVVRELRRCVGADRRPAARPAALNGRAGGDGGLCLQ